MQPAAVDDILVATMSGALIVLFGAAYALLFALGKIRKSRVLLGSSVAAYLGLIVAVRALALALHLEGYWQILVFAMLAGYLVAPPCIWSLCVGTHGGADLNTQSELTAESAGKEVHS